MPSNPGPAELSAMLSVAATHDPAATRVAVSPGLADWMIRHRTSIACTSYQSGQLVIAGVDPEGHVAFSEQNYARATGLCWQDGALHVGSMFQIWRLENMLKPGQYANGRHDMVLVPRAAHTVNYLDTHELAVDRAGRTVFVASRYSCLATLDATFSFRPIWKPRFITALAPEDRCHLNGLAMVEGKPAYVSAIAATDRRDGWRDHRSSGGVVIDVASDEIVTDRLSMPHSPRVHDGSLWALDSGRGRIIRIDRATGKLDDVAFCPGFLRGLAFHRGFAIVTLSKARHGSFGSLPIATDLERSGAPSQCGIAIIDLSSGRIVEWIRYEGRTTEMFDVVALPDIRNPMSLGPQTVEMIGTIAFDDEFAPLFP